MKRLHVATSCLFALGVLALPGLMREACAQQVSRRQFHKTYDQLEARSTTLMRNLRVQLGRPKSRTLIDPQRRLPTVASRIEPVSLASGARKIRPKMMVKIWAQLANGAKVHIEKHRWKPREQFYFYFESAVPIKIALRQHYANGDDVQVMPDPKYPQSFDIVPPGVAFRYPILFETDPDDRDENVSVVAVIAGSGSDPNLDDTANDDNRLYSAKSRRYAQSMDKLYREIRGRKKIRPANNTTDSDVKKQSQNKDDVAILGFTEDNEGYIQITFRK